MTNRPSSFASLRQELASSAIDPRMIVAEAGRKANSNASRNTYLIRYEKEALVRGEELPRLFADVAHRPLLYGVPISIKDCFDVEGSLTSCGSRYYAKVHPPAVKNSWMAQRLLDAGAIITGKTHLHQLAYGITGENADYGDCVQPRDATLLTGGSSSGAAASVQEGSAFAAIGTDTGGSIRVPAALCGLAGYRASFEIGSRLGCWAGAGHLAPSFDTIGVLFRELQDGPVLARALFNVMPEAAPAKVRIGYVGEDFLHDCGAEVLTAYEAWKQQMVLHGAELGLIDTGFWSESSEVFTSIQASEAAALHRGNYEHFEPAIAERLAWGASITSEQLERFRLRLDVFRSRMAALFEQFDLLIAPCAPISRLRAGSALSQVRKACLRYTTPVSLAGLPAVTLPGEHIDAGFGTGVQLIAAQRQDSTLLAFAAELAGMP